MSQQQSALLTDLYQLTMLQAYFLEGMEEPASFELFVRKFPSHRNFLLAMGLDQVLEYLETFGFTENDCAWLESTGLFRPDFLDYLSALRFEGDVDAMPEGTAFFPDEPIIRVTAPLPQAQVIETRLINLLQFQTMIASKAVRSVLAAAGRILVDFGMRRAHGAEAALLAARASYAAGFAGTSNVLAGQWFDIPLFGTMAHSYIMAHDDETEAFARFATSLPAERLVLLVDTYDTLEAVRKIIGMASDGPKPSAAPRWIRLDSGDLGALAADSRKLLDDGNLAGCRIFASGDLDEYAIRALMAAGAPIDGFGVGTRLVTSDDAPFLNCAYKLQEYAGKPRRKRSRGKATWPGRRQVFRQHDGQGRMAGDVIALADELQPGEALLQPAMRHGKPWAPRANVLDAARQRIADQLACLPKRLQSLEPARLYRVGISESLRNLAACMERV